MRKSKFLITYEVDTNSSVIIQPSVINALARMLSAVLLTFGHTFSIKPISIKDSKGQEVIDEKIVRDISLDK